MIKPSTKKPREITPPSCYFHGIPLFTNHFGEISVADHMKKTQAAGKLLVDLANSRTKWRAKTTNGWVALTEGDRQMFMRWLSKFPKLPPRMLTEIADYAGMIEPVSTDITSVVRKGRIYVSSQTECLPNSTKSAIAFLVVAIMYVRCLDSFVCCPECGTWFFDIPSGRPMKKFCSPQHSNRHRQRKYREKRK